MDDTRQLMRLKETLQSKIRVLEAELGTVDAAIQLLYRESHAVDGQVATSALDNRFRKLGLSDACRQIVGSEWILPSEVRNQMLQGGYKSENKGKLLAAVFATLKRLTKKELEGKKIEGRMMYKKRLAATVVDA